MPFHFPKVDGDCLKAKRLEEEKIIRGQVAKGHTLTMMTKLTGFGRERIQKILDELGLKAAKPKPFKQQFKKPS